MAPSPSPTTSRAARRLDDRAVAGVIGFVLVLAVIVSYYAYVAKENVPRWGADNERAWDRRVGESMARLARDAATSAGDHTSVAGVVPGYPEPKAFEVPLLGRTEPVAPGGTLTFRPACSAWWVNATVAGPGAVTVAEVTNADGCLDFRAHPVYASTWGYRYEYGGVLRVENERAIVTVGPPLKLRVLTSAGGSTAERYELALTLVELRGPGASASVDRASVPVDLIAGGATGASDATAAGTSVWAFKSQHPDAWKTWYNARFRGAGLDMDRNAACVAGDAAGPCGTVTVPPGEVAIVLFGPHDSVADLSLSLTRATYDASLR